MDLSSPVRNSTRPSRQWSMWSWRIASMNPGSVARSARKTEIRPVSVRTRFDRPLGAHHHLPLVEAQREPVPVEALLPHERPLVGGEGADRGIGEDRGGLGHDLLGHAAVALDEDDDVVPGRRPGGDQPERPGQRVALPARGDAVDVEGDAGQVLGHDLEEGPDQPFVRAVHDRGDDGGPVAGARRRAEERAVAGERVPRRHHVGGHEEIGGGGRAPRRCAAPPARPWGFRAGRRFPA